MPRSCYIHDGTRGSGSPICSPLDQPQYTPLVGARRLKVPPPVEARSGVTWSQAAFDDSAWARVDLPHDFVLLGNYSETADSHHGYLPRNEAGWYRKKFMLPTGLSATANGSIWLHFEGAFQAVDVWVDGRHVLRHTSGYLGFDVPLNVVGTTHTIVLRADASFGSGHWYEGGGIQRRVWLYMSDGPARFATDGIFAPTPTVTSAGATLAPTAEVVAMAPCVATIFWSLLDPATAAVVASATAQPKSIAQGETVVIEGPIMHVADPKLWSIKTPTLYTLAAVLSTTTTDGALLVDGDNVSTAIGFRSIDWDSQGFHLNEESLRIRGFSHHSDFGGVGGAVPDRINLFRAQALRAVGGNTWRTSHNPYRPAV